MYVVSTSCRRGSVHDKKNLLMTTEVDCDAWTAPCGFLFQNLGKLILHVVLGNTVTNVSTV